MLKRLLVVLALGLMAVSVGAGAQKFEEGVAYTVLKTPIATDDPARIEVVELFWYGCPHCYEMEPPLEKWVKGLPADVNFKRVPAPLNRVWETGGRVYYSLEAVGALDKLHGKLFDAIHKDGLKLMNERAVLEWLEKQGVDTKKYSAAYRSFAVDSKLKRAQQIAQGSEIEGVPALVVNGKYVIPGQSPARMLAIADSLIEQSRKEKAKKQ